MNIMDGGSGGGWVNADATYASGKSTKMGISYHYYAVTNWSAMGPSSGFTVAQYYAQLQRAWAIDGNINGFSIPSTVALCVDEWGAWYDAVAGQGTSFNWSTVRDAVIAGMSLNVFNNRCARVKMALVAQPVNVIQALMLTNSSNQSQMRKTPVFWVFKMYKPHQNATMVPVTWTNNPTNQSIPQLNASASVDASNVLYISVVNTHDANSQSLTINLNNSPRTYSTVTGQIVNGAAITSGITSWTNTDTASLQSFTNFSLAGTTITTTLPAHSVVMLTVSPQVGVKTPGVVRTADDFSIKTLAGGKIMVNFSAAHKTPIRLELYGVDGRTMVESFAGSFEAGQKTLVWQPKARDMGTNLYIVKMEAGEVTKSERLIITK
jgi:alpha-N-arabinofuranosidase